MDTGAGVTSLAALNDWHAALAGFRAEAGDALASLSLALRRTADWLDDQGRHWRHEVREAEEKVTHARSDLRHRRFSGFTGEPPDCTVQKEALRRALARLEFAEGRLELTREWSERLPREIRETCDGPTRHLAFFLDADLARALDVLKRQLTALDAYAGGAQA